MSIVSTFLMRARPWPTPRDQIRTVKDSRIVEIKIDESDKHTHMALVSNNCISDFRAIYTPINIFGEKVGLSKTAHKSLAC